MTDSDSAVTEVPDPLPVRMLNEYAYCPRLFHLMHVQGRWADNTYTIEGKKVHKQIDKLDHVLPDAVTDDNEDEAEDSEAPEKAAGEDPPDVSTSVSLSSEALGLTAKLDLVSTASDEAVPVERKRGRVPNNPERSWEPERVQLMAQGLLLREHGYRCDHGLLYFAASRTRVTVPFTEELEKRTLSLLTEAREVENQTHPPDPLEDSPKCIGCSLAGICLPDETIALSAIREGAVVPDVRRLYPVRDHALPLYIQEQGAYVGKKRSTLVIGKSGEELATARFKDVSQLVLCGNVSISTPTINALCEAGIPIIHLSAGHWFYGITAGIDVRNGFARAAQYRMAEDEDKRLALAKSIVRAKGANQRTLLRRNAEPRPDSALDEMMRHLARVDEIGSPEELLGVEGNLAAAYFRNFGALLKDDGVTRHWDFSKRNRRPPLDPINAMLSFGYALLAKECTTALLGEGLDPWWGLYHRPRHGRPALALDLMEEFRPLVVDSAVITAVNTGMVRERNFEVSAAGCVMKPKARKALIQAYESRLDQLVTHPLFEYRCSWRAILRIQARLMGRWLRGEMAEYTGFTTR